MTYIPHTPQDIEAMLAVIGKKSIQELFAQIPETVRLQGDYQVPSGLTEAELIQHMQQLAAQNQNLDNNVSFMGGGVYQHYIPILVDYLSGRSEFWTAYTPYQPEASQGNLQAIFEYQTAICELTAMEIANASLYDGATALAEALLLAHSHHRGKRSQVLLPVTLAPEYREVTATYLQHLGVQLIDIPEKEGLVDLQSLTELVGKDTTAVVIANPNFFGLVEDMAAVSAIAHKAGALCVSVVNPIALALLAPPGECDVDIAVGDGQELGVPANYGGPSFGFFACRQQFLRKVPGRIVGQTLDGRGDRGFVLTIQTREQHIRREKATSNICTNQALMALRGLLYLACLGKAGLRDVATQCVQKAHYLAEAIAQVPGYSLAYPAPFFNEFVVDCRQSAVATLDQLYQHGIYAGIALERWFPERKNQLLVAVTECRTRQQMDAVVEQLAKI